MTITIGQHVQFKLDNITGQVVGILEGDNRDSDWVHTFGDVVGYVVRWDYDQSTSVQPESHLLIIDDLL
jgi:hypothetical protein